MHSSTSAKISSSHSFFFFSSSFFDFLSFYSSHLFLLPRPLPIIHPIHSTQYFSFHFKQHLTLFSLSPSSFLLFASSPPRPLAPTRCPRADNIVLPQAPRGHAGDLGNEKKNYENHISNGCYSEGIFLFVSFEHADAWPKV